MAQQSLEETFEAACAAKVIPGAVLLAADRSGKFNYSATFGVRSLEDPSKSEPLTADATMWIASCTKLITSIAAMQCVERGLVTLDQDVRPIVHEISDLDIISSDTDGKIVSEKNQSPITLRQLLTHSAGFAYEFSHPLLQEWRKQQSKGPDVTSVYKRFKHPLVFKPGTSWFYGPSIDWAGVVVERVTGSKTLEEYMVKNIWEPLGITRMTFFPRDRPDVLERLAPMSERANPEDPAVKYVGDHPTLDPYLEAKDCQGGGGIFTSAAEYFKILRVVLSMTEASTADGKAAPPVRLLQPSTMRDFFSPQLGEGSHAALKFVVDLPIFNQTVGGSLGIRVDWGLGGLLYLEDLPDWRRKGTMIWGGTPNLSWFIDPETGLCGLYASQVMPFADRKSVDLVHVFEKAIYQRYAAEKK